MNLKAEAELLSFLAKQLPDADLIVEVGIEKYLLKDIRVSHGELCDGTEYIQLALSSVGKINPIPIHADNKDE